MRGFTLLSEDYKDEQMVWDIRFYRVAEYASAGFRKDPLNPGDLFASLKSLTSVAPSDDEDTMGETFNTITKMLNTTSSFDTHLAQD